MREGGRRLKLLIVDDSALTRGVLKRELSKETGFEVSGLASDPYEAVIEIERIDPDVIVLDINMPKMNGLDFLSRMMAQYPIPTVVMSSSADLAARAIQAGAAGFAEKPSPKDGRDIFVFVSELAEKIRCASLREAGIPEGRLRDANRANAENEPLFKASGKAIIAIGASTGGTDAIADIFKELPEGLPGIVIVQHMPAEFTAMFARRLDSISEIRVSEAKHGDKILPNTALVAPGDFQFRVVKNEDGYAASVRPGEKYSGHCPSVDVLFMSLAACAGSDAIGVILTGMGRDGAAGLLEMKKAGAGTIGQDKRSCVVYGMPKVAYDMGAVDVQLPLRQVASGLLSMLSQPR